MLGMSFQEATSLVLTNVLWRGMCATQNSICTTSNHEEASTSPILSQWLRYVRGQIANSSCPLNFLFHGTTSCLTFGHSIVRGAADQKHQTPLRYSGCHPAGGGYRYLRWLGSWWHSKVRESWRWEDWVRRWKSLSVDAPKNHVPLTLFRALSSRGRGNSSQLGTSMGKCKRCHRSSSSGAAAMALWVACSGINDYTQISCKFSYWDKE